MSSDFHIGAVLIGRNEGERLTRCLQSVTASVNGPVVYVDSGSTDDSLSVARAAGAQIIELDTSQKFTAARARNAGLAALINHPQPPDLVQFIDGDCELREGWIESAAALFSTRPDIAVICGRRRERFPEATRYNRLTDAEWGAGEAGEVRSCGGDALMRVQALNEVEGFNPDLIAGEEPELCVRLRKAGWKIWRLEAEMTWHDADMTRFTQWWKRTRRAGHAFAQGAAMHGAPPERHNVGAVRRAVLWGGVLPLVLLLGLFITPWALLLALLWPIKIARLILRGTDAERAFFLTLGNLPEALGVAEYHIKRRLGLGQTLIEYK